MQKNRNPYHVIKSRYVTEKATMLENLQHASSNTCSSRCESPKYVFIVDHKANKNEIARAVCCLYPSVKVKRVNTLNVKPKRRRVRGFIGLRSRVKKAIVTLEKGNILDEKLS